MKSYNSRRLKALTLLWYRLVWRRRSYSLRLTLAFGLALCFALLNRDFDLDYRFQIRPSQSISPEIAIVEISQREWMDLAGLQPSFLKSLKEPTVLTESYFWQPEIWNLLLQKILSQSPSSIGVTFFFGEHFPKISSTIRQSATFKNDRIIWATQLDQEGYVLASPFAKSFSRNAGLMDFQLDSDATARRVTSHAEPLPNLAFQLVKRSNISTLELNPLEPGTAHLINYRGESGTFPTVNLKAVLSNRVPKDFFKNKIVLITATALPNFSVYTPVGKLSRGEYYANLVDNFLFGRWVKKLPFFSLLLILSLLVWLSAWATSNYPQFLALMVLVVCQALLVAASFTLFDLAHIYLPLLPMTSALLGTYMIFLSFQLSIRDFENVQLEKEKEFLVNVEELKNNFFSLLSHDLKTPLAKIQGICDRMLSKNPDQESMQDIEALKTEARELHRYIKTLLHLTKVESKDFRISREPVDLNDIIEQVVELVRPLAAQKSISLTRKLEPMFLIEADPLLMTEVVLNLLENAVKYSPTGGQVTISSQEVDGRVIVLVADNGPGISVADQKFIFDKFYRGQEGMAHSKGSGLGLYLVKYFIERHEGFVLLESASGQGTKVGFSVPVQAATVADSEMGDANAHQT